MPKAAIVEELEPLFNPQSVAVIGATNNWNKWGFSTFSSTLEGFKGKVYPVNNSEDEVLGYKAFKRVTDIPEPVDLAVLVIPAPSIPSAMEDCVAKGIKAGVIIAAGFAETGEEGRKLQDEVVRVAKKGGIRLVGPNCMGYWSASSNLRAFMFPIPIKDGPLAFVTQGGNVGGSVVLSAHERGIGFHRYVSCGCTADIQIEDYIECFGEDPKVKVILTYIEGLNDGKRFTEKVKRVTTKKPVIALKPGKTAAATVAIKSHSGALAGSPMVYDAAFRNAGVIRTESPEELLDVAIGFLTQPLPRGRNVAILTPGGSYGVLCADSCASLGLNVVDLPEETIAALDKVFPPRWSHGNPVDPAGDRNFIAYLTAPEKLLRLDEVDALIFMGFGSFSGFASIASSRSMGFFKAFTSAFSLYEGVGELVPTIGSVLNSGDTSQISKILQPGVSRFASMLGADNHEETEEFTRQLASAIASGKIDISSLVPSPQTSSGKVTKTRGAGKGQLADAMDPLFGALTRQWIESHDKPVITTTFSEVISRLHGKHFAYPSGHRAAVVLAKLVEYKEYLERKGSHE